MRRLISSVFFVLFVGVYTVFGQINLTVEGGGIVPRDFLEKGSEYKIGYGGGLIAHKSFGSHGLYAHPSFTFVPGKEITDNYLSYKVPDLLAYATNIGYAYDILYDLRFTVEGGPLFFTKPSRTVGSNISGGMILRIKNLGIGGHITHFRHDGYKNLFSLKLYYHLL